MTFKCQHLCLQKGRDVARTCLESCCALILNSFSLIRKISKITFHSVTLSLGYVMHNIKRYPTKKAVKIQELIAMMFNTVGDFRRAVVFSLISK